jgi:hypothetical protein
MKNHPVNVFSCFCAALLTAQRVHSFTAPRETNGKIIPMKTRMPVIFLAVLLCFLTAAAEESSTNAAFQQAVSEYQKADKPTAKAAENVIKLAIALDQLPAIPEAARKHFVMGGTLFKEAKHTNDYAAATAEFAEAVRQAPWWPEARYNYALAEEAANDFPGAISDLKLYQLFKQAKDEARAVQDKIYSLEARAKLAQKRREEQEQAAATAAAATKAENDGYYRRLGFLAGQWNATEETIFRVRLARSVSIPPIKSIVNIKIDGNQVKLIPEAGDEYILIGTITASDYRSIKWVARFVGFGRHNIDSIPDVSIEVGISDSGDEINFTMPSTQLVSSGWKSSGWVYDVVHPWRLRK